MSAIVHTIHRQTFELRLRSREKAAGLQQQVRDLYEAQLLPIIDRFFTQAAGAGEVLVIDRLVLDLGVLKWNALDEELCEQLGNALREKLSALKDDARGSVTGIPAQKETPVVALHEGAAAVLNFLRYYFTQGTLPWWIPDEQEPPDADKLVIELLEQQAASLVQLLNELRHRPAALQRIRQQLAPAVFARLTELLLRELPPGLHAEPAFIAELEKTLRLLHAETPPAEMLTLPVLLLLPDRRHEETPPGAQEKTLHAVLLAASREVRQQPENFARGVYAALLKNLAAQKAIPSAGIFVNYFRWWETKHAGLALQHPRSEKPVLGLLPEMRSAEKKISFEAAAVLAEALRESAFEEKIAEAQKAAQADENETHERNLEKQRARTGRSKDLFTGGANEEEDEEIFTRGKKRTAPPQDKSSKKFRDNFDAQEFPGEDAQEDPDNRQTLSPGKRAKKKSAGELKKQSAKPRRLPGSESGNDPDDAEASEENRPAKRKRDSENPGEEGTRSKTARTLRLEPGGRPFLKPLDEETQNEEERHAFTAEEEQRARAASKSSHSSIPWFEEEEPAAVMTRYAGLVLVSPFLPPFFGELKLLNDEGKFINDAAALKALHLLNLVAGGKSRPQEYTLALHKLLCGIPFTQPVPRTVKLSAAEKKEAMLLLDEIALQWTAMKTESGKALQQAFMKRNGIIEKKDGALLLRIERSGIDVMLDTLPWSISLIRHPWMEQMLHVEW